MKVAFLFHKDSHFKAVKATALRICAQYDLTPVFIGLDSDYEHNESIYSVSYVQSNDLTILLSFDYVVACLGGYLLNKIANKLKHTNTKVISIFPGIVSHYQLDAFISRLHVDEVWLNSKADLQLYDKICRLFKYPCNGVVYGMSWLQLEKCKINTSITTHPAKAIIFEQTEILDSRKSKKRFLKVLEGIITANNDIEFYYKIRDNTTDDYFIELRKYIDKYPNVKIVADLNNFDPDLADLYLSISSSALIEGIAYGKDAYIIDSRLLDLDSEDFFRHSNLELKNKNLSANKFNMNNKWYMNRVALPSRKINLSSIKKNSAIDSHKRRNFRYIKSMVLRLSLYYPKLARLVLNKPRLMAIQKSLEYLSTNTYE